MRFSINYLLGLIVVILTVLGVSMESSFVPNQEIVFKYDTSDASEESIERAIDAVQNKLSETNARNIQLQNLGEGILKITYYSNEEVSQIREMLTSSLVVIQTNSEKNQDTDDTASYQFDIHSLEVQNGGSLTSTGITLIENKTEINRSIQPFQSLGTQSFVDSIPVIINVENTFSATRSDIIPSKYNKIPESRAGPVIG